jgi:predicted transcriptional regulator
LLRRTGANVEDLAAFFSARGREDAIEAWLTERVNGVLAQAARRRSKARVSAGGALRAMRDRGENLREIARMAGVTDKTVREFIREVDAAAEPGPAPQSGVEGSEPAGAAGVAADFRIEDLGVRTSGAGGAGAERMEASANA